MLVEFVQVENRDIFRPRLGYDLSYSETQKRLNLIAMVFKNTAEQLNGGYVAMMDGRKGDKFYRRKRCCKQYKA